MTLPKSWIAKNAERVAKYNTGYTAAESHERAMRINKEWYEEKEKYGLTYAELGARHGVSGERARIRCKRWAERAEE